MSQISKALINRSVIFNAVHQNNQQIKEQNNQWVIQSLD